MYRKLQVGHCNGWSDGVKFEFNDIMILYCIRKTVLSENGQSAYDITKYTW